MANQLGEGKGSREEKLAKLLELPIEKVFEYIPIPESSFELAARIQKKKALGLDVSVEESIRKARQLEKDIARIKSEIKSEPPLKPEQIEMLVGLTKGVLNDLTAA